MAKKIPNEMRLLDEWTKRLGLQDWAIVLETECHPADMRVDESLGCTSWQESTKTALIQIVDPGKMDHLTRQYDFEEVLVHELLHLKMSLLGSADNNENLQDRVLHQVVDDLARAFVDAKRSGGKPSD